MGVEILFVANIQPCLRLNLHRRRLEPNQPPSPRGLKLPNLKARQRLRQQSQNQKGNQQRPRQPSQPRQSQKGNQLRLSLRPIQSQKTRRRQEPPNPTLSPRLTLSHPPQPRLKPRKPRPSLRQPSPSPRLRPSLRLTSPRQ